MRYNSGAFLFLQTMGGFYDDSDLRIEVCLRVLIAGARRSSS